MKYDIIKKYRKYFMIMEVNYMINVLRMVCISLKEPVISLLQKIIFLLIWIGTVIGVMTLISVVSGKNAANMLSYKIITFISVLSLSVPFTVFYHAGKVKEALKYAELNRVSYEVAWKEVTGGYNS